MLGQLKAEVILVSVRGEPVLSPRSEVSPKENSLGGSLREASVMAWPTKAPDIWAASSTWRWVVSWAVGPRPGA